MAKNSFFNLCLYLYVLTGAMICTGVLLAWATVGLPSDTNLWVLIPIMASVILAARNLK